IRRHTPITTPFPYTTLFRSDHARESHEAERKDGEIHQHTEPEPRQFPDCVAASALLAFHVTHPRGANVLRDLKNQSIDVWIRSADRKSTRLNSSHQIISYAV